MVSIVVVDRTRRAVHIIRIVPNEEGHQEDA